MDTARRVTVDVANVSIGVPGNCVMSPTAPVRANVGWMILAIGQVVQVKARTDGVRVRVLMSLLSVYVL